MRYSLKGASKTAELAAEQVEEDPGVQPLVGGLDGASAAAPVAGISGVASFVVAVDAAVANGDGVAVVAAAGAAVVRLACEPPGRDGR